MHFILSRLYHARTMSRCHHNCLSYWQWNTTCSTPLSLVFMIDMYEFCKMFCISCKHSEHRASMVSRMCDTRTPRRWPYTFLRMHPLGIRKIHVTRRTIKLGYCNQRIAHHFTDAPNCLSILCVRTKQLQMVQTLYAHRTQPNASSEVCNGVLFTTIPYSFFLSTYDVLLNILIPKTTDTG